MRDRSEQADNEESDNPTAAISITEEIIIVAPRNIPQVFVLGRDKVYLGPSARQNSRVLTLQCLCSNVTVLLELLSELLLSEVQDMLPEHLYVFLPLPEPLLALLLILSLVLLIQCPVLAADDLVDHFLLRFDAGHLVDQAELLLLLVSLVRPDLLLDAGRLL